MSNFGDHKSQIEELKKAASITSSETYLKKSEIEGIFLSINPSSQAPLLLVHLGNYANWIQYFDYHKSRTQTFIQKIFVKMPFLETKLVSLLANIDDCSHFMVLGYTVNRQYINKDMSTWASGFYNYSVLCKELDDYYQQYLEKFK